MRFLRRRIDDEPDLPEPPVADAPGTLPPDVPELPPGRALVSDPDATEVGWISDEHWSAWSELAELFPGSGLWPVLVAPYGGDDRDPLEELDLELGRGPVAETDAAAVLAELWGVDAEDADDPDFLEVLAPFGARFPGLAGIRPERRPGGIGKAVKSMANWSRLALVPVTRGADVPAAIGWSGPVNLTDEVWKLSVVLRSWEERFGALVVGIGFDTLTLAVRRPPAGDAALAVAAEHFAFCPDNITQGAGTMSRYAREIDGAVAWSFWWD
ncbi:MAG TPA: DUF4253 domain-containing protein [Thermoleophilaceae bacterium]